ncbi:MEDS domain-containing protein [Desulfosoma caldarium]|uniref:DcmR-like sensory protein n=1 Tax=Desulfosoma caldarium TaxID=610254 RepID=A0A3N1VMQ0_9BACT|nr:MEDS domain-containing protein [Desulfosoma caldarium]ROR03230.1 DcmR-like sensory protein [Desulfosoma caldarium]
MTENPREAKAHAQHFCACYATREDRNSLIESFLCDGLVRGEQILCVGSNMEGAGQKILSSPCVDGTGQPRAHQVTFHRAESLYLSNGAFDPDRVLSLLVSCVGSALEMGFTGVRVISDALWLLEHPLGAHQVVDYEHRVNEVAKGLPCSLLCLYPGRALPKAFLTYVFLTHPYVVRKGRRFFNPHYKDFDVLMDGPFQTSTYETLVKALVPIRP